MNTRIQIALSALLVILAVFMGAMNTAATSEPLAIGDTAPDFTLTDLLTGDTHTLTQYTDAGKTVVLEWFSPDCPFVRKHYRDDTGTMTNLQSQFEDQDIVWLRINSARKDHPYANPERNIEVAEEWDINTPILMDTTGATGKAYGAKRTPDMYIISPDQTLAYIGAIDNRSDAAAPGDVNYVENALNELVAGQPVSKSTTKRYGCRIKYN